MVFDKLVELFLKFPGIGPRQARRFAFFLAGQNEKYIEELINALAQVKSEVRQCLSCYRFFNGAGDKCGICANKNREDIVMVVEKDVDLENIEKSGVYNGKYFVLGGVLSLNNGSESGLRFKNLFEKITANKPEEIIIATSATVEGDNTARYIQKVLEPIRQAQGEPIKITRLGRGLSTGTELEYSDDETISNALKNRK